eukprot:405243-Pyramimonas_sp.AAC.1
MMPCTVRAGLQRFRRQVATRTRQQPIIGRPIATCGTQNPDSRAPERRAKACGRSLEAVGNTFRRTWKKLPTDLLESFWADVLGNAEK